MAKKTIRVCWVTDEPVDWWTDCWNCETRSCPINTGNETDPKEVEVESDEPEDDEKS